MAKKAAVIMPQTREILAQMGEQIRLARLRKHGRSWHRWVSRFAWPDCAGS